MRRTKEEKAARRDERRARRETRREARREKRQQKRAAKADKYERQGKYKKAERQRGKIARSDARAQRRAEKKGYDLGGVSGRGGGGSSTTSTSRIQGSFSQQDFEKKLSLNKNTACAATSAALAMKEQYPDTTFDQYKKGLENAIKDGDFRKREGQTDFEELFEHYEKATGKKAPQLIGDTKYDWKPKKSDFELVRYGTENKNEHWNYKDAKGEIDSYKNWDDKGRTITRRTYWSW